jgi:ribonucleoside-diphosphate reductase alpha chain
MKIIKRDGYTREEYNLTKIINAANKAFERAGRELEGYKLAEYLEESFFEEDEITVQDIQNLVEIALLDLGYKDVAHEYMSYRIKRDIEREARLQNPWADMDERQEIVLSKYTKKGETKADFLRRIGIGNSELENIFRDKEAIWGGRNLYAVGREGNITGSNCYVATDPEDNLDDIYRADFELARTYSYGGGQGLNLSKLRPKGAKVNNSSNTTPGIMVFAEKYSHTTLNTQQESRRGALMLVLNSDHPDIIEFCTAKLDLSKVNGANISIAMDDKFMNAVVNDEPWVMRFETDHEIIQKEVPAKDLMDLISYAVHTMGDPGVLFIDNVNNYHLLSEYKDVVFTATNPCGEQPLMANGSCNLGSINLFSFVRQPFTPHAYFDFKRFEEVTKQMIWGLDDLLTLLGGRHALPAQRQHVIQWREVGLGVMGLADLALGFSTAYGSDEFIAIVDRIMHHMINAAVQGSALRAKDMGAFPKYNYKNISSSSFFKEVLTDETKELVKKYGLRNSRLLSIAPTGSISNVLGISGGVEPYFMLGYQRVIKSIYEEETAIWVYEKTPKLLMDYLGLEGDVEQLPTWAKITSQNIEFARRAQVQATIQKYVDTAISSTFNVPNEATTEDIKNIYIAAWTLKLKGATVWRDNCAKVGILSGGGEHFDANPAPKPSFTLNETWYNKATDTTRNILNKIVVADTGYKSQKTEHDTCPVCNAPLVKRDGCTKCSDPDCYYEKCAI